MAKNKQNRIVVINIISTILLEGIAFFTAPIFSRILGTANYGVVALFNTWSAICAIVFSLRLSGTIAISRKDYDDDIQPKYQSSILFLSISSYIVFSSIVLLLINPISSLLALEKEVIYFILVGGLSNAILTFANSKFTFEFKAGYNLILSLVASLGSIILSYILIVYLPKAINFYGRIAGKVIVDVILAVIVCVFIFKKGKTFYSKEYWAYAIPLAIPFVFHMLSNRILSQSDRVMLNAFIDKSTVGIYSFAYSFSLIISMIYSALNKSWSPFFYEYKKNNESEKLNYHANNYMELFTIICAGFLLLFPEVFKWYAPSDYYGGAVLIPILVVGFYMQFHYSFAVNYEFYNKKVKYTATVTVITAFLNIVLNYFMIRRYSIVGAAVASSISYFFEFLLHYLYAKYMIKDDVYPFPISFILKYIVAFVGFYIVYMFTIDYWIIRWIISGILAVYILVKIYRRKMIF